MISAGTIGGGQTPAPGAAPPAPTGGNTVINQAAPPVGSAGVEGSRPTFSAPVTPLSAEQFTAEMGKQRTFSAEQAGLERNWASAEGDKNRSMQYANWGFQIGSQLVGAIFQGIYAHQEFDFRYKITDRIATKEETIAGYQKEVALKTLELLPELEKERAKAAEDIEEVREKHRDRRHERSLRSRERIAATQTLDRAFGMRSDYPYGNPFAA